MRSGSKTTKVRGEALRGPPGRRTVPVSSTLNTCASSPWRCGRFSGDLRTSRRLSASQTRSCNGANGYAASFGESQLALHGQRAPRFLRHYTHSYRLHRRVSRDARPRRLSRHRLQQIKSGKREFSIWANLRKPCKLPGEFAVSRGAHFASL